MATEVKEYSSSFWAQVAFYVAGLLFVIGVVGMIAALVATHLGRMTSDEGWWFAALGLSVIAAAAPLGALGAIVEEIRKLRWAWSQVHDVSPEVIARPPQIEGPEGG